MPCQQSGEMEIIVRTRGTLTQMVSHKKWSTNGRGGSYVGIGKFSTCTGIYFKEPSYIQMLVYKI